MSYNQYQSRNNTNNNPIYIAITRNLPVAEIKEIIEKNLEYLNEPNDVGATPLATAINSGKISIVECVLGFNPDYDENCDKVLDDCKNKKIKNLISDHYGY